MSDLKSLQLESSANVQSVDCDIFNCLKNLRRLELNQVNDVMLDILYTKCVKQIKDLTIIYNVEQNLTL